MSLRDGSHTTERAEWMTGPCAIPLFGDAERDSGICRGCRKGWTHPENFMTRKGERQAKGLEP
jgi:hypothetical protein